MDFFAGKRITVEEPIERPKTKADLEQERFEQLVSEARRIVNGAIAKKQKLLVNLRNDLKKHGDPAEWKRYGDLILANLNSAVRMGDEIRVTDHFADDASMVVIAGDAERSLIEIANAYFRRYTKARNGQSVIKERIAAANDDLGSKREMLRLVEQAIETRDAEFLRSVAEPRRKATEVRTKKKKDIEFKGARSFVSSDGFEILVGRRAEDNDRLTFRVAGSLDTWMHAADYPGSHVVIRNPNRKEVPQRTLLEAAQIAAFYSTARELGKAAVNYTLKKFVNKPKRAARGLVSLSSFKTILVKPMIPKELSKE